MIESMGEKVVSATGTFSNIKHFGDGHAYYYLDKEPKDADIYETHNVLKGFEYEAKTVKLVDTETVAEASVLKTRQDKNFGKEFLVAIKQTIDPEQYKPIMINETTIKQYIAWYGPVLTTFEVEKDTLKNYIQKNDTKEILPIPAKSSSKGRLTDLSIVLFGWIEAIGDKPAHWVGKALYASFNFDGDDIEAQIARVAIGKEETTGHVTNEVKWMEFVLTTENIPKPDPVPIPDASFGLVPSLFMIIISLFSCEILL